MVYIANMMFSPVLDLLHAHGARDKVCHPELVSGSKLSANHTSPYPLLLRRGYSSLSKSRLVQNFIRFGISLKGDYLNVEESY